MPLTIHGFPRRTAVALTVVLLLVGAGCTPVGTPGPAAPEPVPEGPALRDGPRIPADARAAAGLLAEGEALLREGDAEGARERALEVESRYPEAVGSARALWLRARAERALERWRDGERTVAGYLDVAPSDDPLRGDAALLRARIRWEGELGGAVEALFQVPQGSRGRILDDAQSLGLEMARNMETALLRDLIREAPRHPAVLPPFLTELSVREFLAGNEIRSRELARDALGFSPGGEVAERAHAVLDGRVEEEVGVAVYLGGLLPESASPGLQELARAVRSGIELAVARSAERDRRPAQFVPVDDEGEFDGVARGIQLLEERGVTGVIGPVLEPLLDEAVRARSGSVPMISPTARVLPPGATGVYSLTAAEPGPPRLLARMALSREVESVVIMYPSTPDMVAQAWWFQEAFQAGGGIVIRSLTYGPGTTSFQGPLEEVVELEPDALILFLPPEDVEVVAPQIAYWGVDDLEGLLLFGNESWSSQRVIETVPTRHTDGVFTVSSREPDGELGPGWSDFEAAFEEHFMRSLRSPSAALGYDAASLLLEAARTGDGTPEGTLRALERIRDFPGATGLLSIVDGRIQRAYLPVQIQDRRLMPVAP
jgi:ABC-type branched-subunit amino acid transport system substrate-binding protein